MNLGRGSDHETLMVVLRSASPDRASMVRVSVHCQFPPTPGAAVTPCGLGAIRTVWAPKSV